MTPNLGSPLPADEMLHHQTADLMGRVSESDLGWTEKIWFSIPKKDGSLQIDFGLGRYQNRNIMDGFAGISRNCEQWTVRGSRVLASDPVATSVGPIEYEVVEPLKILRARLQENEVQPISFEIEFEALNPPFCEDRHLQRDEGGYRAVSDIVRYHQAGSVKGWVSVEGKREDIKTDDWIAFRDHSWGVRLDVGASPVDLKPARDWGDKKLAEAAFLLQWSPMFMERPNGERFEYHYYLQMRDHKPFYFSGYRNHYSLAAAARPALGEYGVWFTVAIAMLATAGGILASIFAVSRMLAMLTEMKLVPHSHFGMPGSIQKHTLVYTVVLGLVLTAFFDLSRIAALGIIFYLVMDIAIHWGVLRYLLDDVKAKSWVPVTAIILDFLALSGFVWVKLNSDPFVLGVAVVTMMLIAIGEQLFLGSEKRKQAVSQSQAHERHH
ncbi:hypothetical protein [Spongiibacter tropicus]|uniref:hypothetical protein n=1 Tax=Spongiibacter tropicus TaxID=454602 RepID=UPI0035BE5BFC